MQARTYRWVQGITLTGTMSQSFLLDAPFCPIGLQSIVKFPVRIAKDRQGNRLDICIDLALVCSYNTRMEFVNPTPAEMPPYYGGFFRPDHDPPFAPVS